MMGGEIGVVSNNENGSDKRSYRVAFDKFNSVARGWLPQQDLKSSVLEIEDKMRPYVQKYENFRSGPLIRLNVLRDLLKKSEIDNSLRKVKTNVG